MIGDLKKALGGGGLRHLVETALTGGAATGVRMVEQGKKAEKRKKAKKARGEARTAAERGKAAKASAMKKRRMVLGRRGVQSTRRSRTTPKLFAGSAGEAKKLGA